MTLFGTEKNLGDWGENAARMAPYYISMFRDSTRVKGLSSRAGWLTQDIYNSANQEYATVVSFFRPDVQVPSRDRAFLEQIKENIEFVIGVYRGRLSWPESLLDQLRNEAVRYGEQSRYIEVRDLSSDTFMPHRLRGAMKIVEVRENSRISQLPLELDFGITLATNGGRKYEVGNLALADESDSRTRAELVTQLILHARKALRDHTHEAGKMLYFTPADPVHFRLYKRLGFTPVPGHEEPLREGDLPWRMIGASAETIAELPHRLAQLKSQWQPEEVEWLTQLLRNFENLGGDQIELRGAWTRSIRALGGDVPKKIGVFVSEPFTFKNQDYRRISILGSGGGGLEINLRVPVDAFPFRNGWKQDLNDSSRLKYENGVFTIEQDLWERIVRIRTAPGFDRPHALWYHDKYRSYSASF